MLWLAGAQLVARLTGSRATGLDVLGPGIAPDPPVAVPRDDDRQPSERMRVAWSVARADGDAERVAQVADVPRALAELILADARFDPGRYDT